MGDGDIIKDAKTSGGEQADDTENDAIGEAAAGLSVPTLPVEAATGTDLSSPQGDPSNQIDLNSLSQKMESSSAEDQPTDEEKADFQEEAKESLDQALGPFTPPESREKAQAIQAAILSGDNEALGKAIAGMSADEVRKYADVIQKNLNSLDAGVTVKPTGDGKSLFLHEQGSSTALVIDNNGVSRPVSVKEGPDGKVHIDNTSTPTDSAPDIAAGISNSATRNGRQPLAHFGQGGGGSDGHDTVQQPEIKLPSLSATSTVDSFRDKAVIDWRDNLKAIGKNK